MFPNSDCNLQSPWLPVMLAVSSSPPEGCEVLRSAVEVTNGNSSILFAFNIVLIANIIIFNKYIPTANIRWENSCDQCCLHISQVAYKDTHTKLHIISCTMWPCVVFFDYNSIYCVIIILIIIAMTMFMVLSSWPKVHPVHLMNVAWAPGGRQPSDQASRLGLWVRRKLAAIIHIHHRHCYYYLARRLILFLPSHEGWKAE